MTRWDDDMSQALRELESSAPIAAPPALDGRRPRFQLMWAGLAAAAAIVVGISLGAAIVSNRNGQPPSIGSSGSPATSGGPTAPPSIRPSVAPSPSAAASVSPTIVARSDWSRVPGDAFGAGRLDSIAEARGRLFALGSDASVQPMVWFSDDGAAWQPAEVEDVPRPYGGQVKALVDAGDRLVALAGVGLAEGSSYLGAVIYTSDDGGATWNAVDATPGLTAAAMYDHAMAGSRVVAVGSSVWTSDDGGLTWMDSPGFEAGGGEAIRAVSGDDRLLLGTGSSGGEITSPPMLAWLSRDGGLTWQRSVIDDTGDGPVALVTSSGELLVGGYETEPLQRSAVWSSSDDGATWAPRDIGEVPCCASSMTETSTGIVMGIRSLDRPGLLVSGDGTSWSFEALDFEPIALTWTPTFGLVAVTNDGEIAFGPQPYP
jgi:hypothetical protein